MYEQPCLNAAEVPARPQAFILRAPVSEDVASNMMWDHSLFLLLRMTTAITIATIIKRRTKRPKHIHLFLRAARAELTALSV